MTVCPYRERERKRGVSEKNTENFCSSFVFNTVKRGRGRERVLTPAQGSKITSSYRTARHVFCKAATQHHTLGAEKLRFWSGGSYFRTGGRRGSRVHESSHSSDKAQRNLLPITWEPVKTFSLIYLFFFLSYICLHTCSMDIAFQASSGISL